MLVDVRPHWSFLSAPLAAAVVVLAIGISLDVGIPHTSVPLHWVEGVVAAVPCVWLAFRFVRWRTTGLRVTSVRLIGHWGVLARREWEIRFADIAEVIVVQNSLRRLVGTGRLELVLWDDGHVRWIDDVRRPAALGRVIARRLGPPPDVDPHGVDASA